MKEMLQVFGLAKPKAHISAADLNSSKVPRCRPWTPSTGQTSLPEKVGCPLRAQPYAPNLKDWQRRLEKQRA